MGFLILRLRLLGFHGDIMIAGEQQRAASQEALCKEGS